MSPLPDLTLPTSHPNLSIIKGNKRLNQGLKAYKNSNEDVDISNLNTGQPCHLLTAPQIFTCQLRVSRTVPRHLLPFPLDYNPGDLVPKGGILPRPREM